MYTHTPGCLSPGPSPGDFNPPHNRAGRSVIGTLFLELKEYLFRG